MTFFPGHLVLARIDISASQTLIGSMRVGSWEVSNPPVDTTTKDLTNRYTSLHSVASRATVTGSFSGLMSDDAGMSELQDIAFHATDPSSAMEFTSGEGDKASGTFQVTSWGISGGFDDMAEVSFSVQNAGAVTIGADV